MRRHDVMRNVTCWAIVALLTLQVSLIGINFSEEPQNGFEDETEETISFSGRQSPGMNGNTTEESSCALSKWHNLSLIHV